MFGDRSVLDAFRNGDKAVLARVYAHHMPVVAQLARKGFSFQSAGQSHRFFGFTQDYEQEDVIQETFVRAFSKRARLAYDGLSPYEAYLTGIVKNVIIDIFRSRSSRLLVFDAEIHKRQSSGQPPDIGLDRELLSSLVRDFVEQLPLLEQRMVRFRFQQRLPQQEAAKKMRVSRSTIRTLENRVRKKLKNQLKAKGLFEDNGFSSPPLACLLLLG